MTFQKGHPKYTSKGDFKKGHIPWNKGTKGLMKPNSGSFKKGNIPWNKGKKNCYTEEQLEKYRQSHLNHIPSQETRRKMSEKRKGNNNVRWNPEGRSYDKSGYVLIRNGKGVRGWQREHVAIAESVLGRSLNKGEVVHHINGIKDDNRHSNLLICTQSYHRWFEGRMAFLYKQEHFC